MPGARAQNAFSLPLASCRARRKIGCAASPSQVLLSSPEQGGQKSRFICLTCLKYLRSKKLPPVSVLNNLKLFESDKRLAEQGLEMTPLEGNLIAKRIIFQKIVLLPKSRWTALKDKQVNIPITDDSLNSTLQQMPRTPQKAGLIGVALKRKMEYKGSHQHQYINACFYRACDTATASVSGQQYYLFLVTTARGVHQKQELLLARNTTYC